MESQNNNMDGPAGPFNGIGYDERSERSNRVRIFRGLLVAIVVIGAVVVGVWLGIEDDDTSDSSFQASDVGGSDNSTTTSDAPSRAPTTAISIGPSYRPSAAPSPAPSSAPSISLSTDRRAYLESVLGNSVLLHQLAFDWMCNIDIWEPSEGRESYPEQWHDRYAAVAFHYATNNDDPDTFNYSQFSGASTQSTCIWLAALPNNFNPCRLAAVGSKVTFLSGRASAYSYAGSKSPSAYVPSAIGLLTNLERLSHVRMDSPLPSEIGLLTALQSCFFDNDTENYELSTIPTEIGLLTNLQQLQGNYAGLKGTIPSELMSLTALTLLSLDSNQLSGTIPPTIIGLTDLDYLNFRHNRLTGAIPPLPIEQFDTGRCLLDNNLFDNVTIGATANCYTHGQEYPNRHS